MIRERLELRDLITCDVCSGLMLIYRVHVTCALCTFLGAGGTQTIWSFVKAPFLGWLSASAQTNPPQTTPPHHLLHIPFEAKFGTDE